MTTRSRPGGGIAIAEPAVALTDALLAVETGVFAARLWSRPAAPGGLRMPFVTFLAATTVASGTGAILHGMTSDRADPLRRRLWRVSMTAIGVAAVSSWWAAARLLDRSGGGDRLARRATALHVPYFVLVAVRDVPYVAAVACYVPGAAVLTGAFARRLGAPGERTAASLGLAGLGVTFAAAAVQVRRIGLGRAFDHNALYHSLQAVGIALLDASARSWLDLEVAAAEG